MNIWYLHHYATPYEMPGLHRPFEFGEYFKQKNNEITVFSASYLHFADENMISGKQLHIEKEYNGIRTIFVKTCSYAGSGIKRVINMFQFGFNLLRTRKYVAARYAKPDVIIASSPHPITMLAGIKMAKKYKIPCICEVRDLWPEVFFFGGRVRERGIIGRILLWGEKLIYTKANALVFLKEGDHTYITDHKWDIEQGGSIDMNKCYYINNGVDINLFDKRIHDHKFEDHDLDNGKFNVVYCGTIRPVNNIDALLDVGKMLGEDVQILIFGQGNCVEQLEKRIESEHITNVKLKGYVNNQYIPSILSRSSLNILNYSGTSYNWSRGNSSNKMFEYLASGKPVLSTVKMGYDILEQYNCGVSVNENTAESIAQTIRIMKNLSEEEYSEMCKNARNAATHFDIPILAKKYLDLIETISKRQI